MDWMKTIFWWIMFVPEWTRCGKTEEGLRLLEVVVPRYADIRKSATMACSFDVDGGRLFSVKWYKDENEFYRYMPDNVPKIKTFPIAGLNLDLSRSNTSAVTLHPLTYNASGNYKCDVSVDWPTFQIVAGSGNFTVLATPDKDPSIEGLQTHYAIGEYLVANCTSSPTNPPMQLSWHLNNKKIGEENTLEYGTVMAGGNRFVSKLGLRLQLLVHHMKGPMELKCKGKLSDYLEYEKRIAITVRSAAEKKNRKAATDRYRNAADTIFGSSANLFISTTALAIYGSSFL